MLFSLKAQIEHTLCMPCMRLLELKLQEYWRANNYPRREFSLYRVYHHPVPESYRLHNFVSHPTNDLDKIACQLLGGDE